MRMYETPSFVKWVDGEIYEDAKQKVLDKYGISGLRSKIDLTKLSWQDLRTLATVIYAAGFKNDGLYDQIEGKNIRNLRDALNKEFDNRLGDVVEIYNVLDSKFNTEKWMGEQRYSLLSITGYKGQNELGVLKNTAWFISMLGKEITVQSSLEMVKAFTFGLYHEFGYEVNKGKFDESPKQFAICNEERKREIKAQNDFVDSIFNKDYALAYTFIKDQVDVAMGRKKLK